MNGPGTISELQLFATHDASSEAVFFQAEILFCHTTLDELTTTFEANYAGFEPARAHWLDTLSIDWTAPGWNGFELQQPFEYDGEHNLIIEFRYLGEDGRTINAKAFYPPTPNRTLDAGLPTSSTGELLSFMNSLRIYFTPPTGTGGEEGAAAPGISALSCPSADPVFTIVMPTACPAGLGLYSSDGRLVWRWSGASLEAGETTVRGIPGDLPPGVYTAVLEACGSTVSTRVAILR